MTPKPAGRHFGRCPSDPRAFTLIELILTIAVAAIAFVPLAVFIGEDVRASFTAKDNLAALHLAESHLAEVHLTPYDSLAVGSFSNPNYLGYPYDLTRTVSYQAGSASTAESLKKVTVTVRRAGSANVLASFVTYFARNVITGV
jgi:prepilin-type N-terminal cleavage/methylation domain-containing protein